MRRPIVLGALWVLAAVVAVAVAWAGVGVVGDQVTDERPAPLAAADIEARLEAEATTTTTSPSTTALPGGQPADTTVPGPANPPPTAAPAPTPTTGAAPPPSVAPAAAVTRTYNMVGGTASLRFSPEGVTVVFATPNAGFSVDTEPEHGNGVRVEFESPTHESRVDGWWDGGPVDRVREEADD